MNNLENFAGPCRRPMLQVIGHAGIDYIIEVESFGDEETSTQIKSIKKYACFLSGSENIIHVEDNGEIE